jgi:hypothetical protein
MATRTLVSPRLVGSVIVDSPKGGATGPRKEVASVDAVGFTHVVTYIDGSRTQFGTLTFVWVIPE